MFLIQKQYFTSTSQRTTADNTLQSSTPTVKVSYTVAITISYFHSNTSNNYSPALYRLKWSSILQSKQGHALVQFQSTLAPIVESSPFIMVHALFIAFIMTFDYP